MRAWPSVQILFMYSSSPSYKFIVLCFMCFMCFKSAALIEGSSSLWSFVNVEWIYSLKTDIFCTKRCLATVSNNSATTPFYLLVITNGDKVHARTLTSVCKSGIFTDSVYSQSKPVLMPRVSIAGITKLESVILISGNWEDYLPTNNFSAHKSGSRRTLITN